MSTETRNCQNCKQDFTIEPDDFAFYEKMKVPPPTWCSDCRFQRRMAWRNFWHLFKKTEKRTGNKIFSLFPEESPVIIYEREFWNSDDWDPMSYGRDYDWKRPFFEQFKDFLYSVPHPAHSVINVVNSQYCTNVNHIKNCYLVRASSHSEDCAYLIWDNASKSSMDGHMTDQCELSYGNVNVALSFKTLFSVDCRDCRDVILSKDCIGCNNCFGCVGLRNKSYCIFNEQHTKEEYQKKLDEMNIGSHKALCALQNKIHDYWETFPNKYMHSRQTVNATGDYIFESKNTLKSFRVRECEDVKYCQNLLGSAKDCYDYSNWGDNVELLYECLVCGLGNSRLRFCAQCYPNNRDLEYCMWCQRSSYLFGCVGLKDKQYCIFNKQYTKEEYEELVPKLKEHMNTMPYVDQKGRIYKYGEFFPLEMSPFSYAVTEAAEFFPLSENQAKDLGLNWYSIKAEEHSPTFDFSEVPDHINDVPESIINEVISCGHAGLCKHECAKAFRVIKDEMNFCRKLGIPLPRLCPNCRHYERLTWRNLSRLYRKKCDCTGEGSDNEVYSNQVKHFHNTNHCPNEFETSYSPEGKEIVYCEQCYNAEVV